MRTGSKDKEKLKRMLGYKDPLLFNYFEEKLNPGVSDGQAIGDRFGIPTNVAGGGFPDSLSIEDGEENLLEPTANIYPHLRVANSLNWRQIRDLNPLCKYAFFSDDVWTIDTTVMSPEVIPNLPIRIGERPVILNYLPSTIGSFPYHPDPAANRPIDPRKDVDDETLRFLFRVYPGARAACVYLNKTLVILHDGELNRRAEFRKRPRKFGGLHVDHALFNRRYTAGSVVERGRRIEIGSDGFGFKYSLDGEVFGFTDLRVGLRLRHKIKTDCEVLTMPVHSLLSTIEYLYEAPTGTQKKIENTPWYNPAEFLNTNGKNFKFDYFGKEFGKLHSHFESISNSNPRGDLRMLQYDIALIEELDKKSPKMPFPTFEDSSRNTIEMEWADIKDEDFINQDIVLLGFNFESHAQVSEQNEGGESTSQPRHGPVQRKHTGTATQPGATLATPRDYKNKTVKMDKKSIMTLETEGPTSVPTVVEGRYYEKLQNKICDLSYFQRSILWRPDFRRKTKGGQPERMSERGADSDGLPSIGGASGCPLAVKTHRGNKTVYKIFGFQNSENVGIPDDPGTKPDRWVADALLGNFRTYQSICLPEELTQQWEIVWERPKSPSVEPEDLDIEMGDQRDKERDETRGKVAKRQQQTINKVSKMPVESPRQRRLHQKKVNRVIRQIVENGLTAEEFALQPQKSPTQERLEPPVGI
ncbi:uncharacterized protein DFL_007023 [Arthrobotrys flagrans]|uniref:Uncharacterized protein n=1 Tax=Arthrobotrys flagrans TaxID=97331 RepID=A0A436ZUG7_ARTFL|nr:hypothetical protein DFL_007023 [Arthrobotrys flagrans]